MTESVAASVAYQPPDYDAPCSDCTAYIRRRWIVIGRHLVGLARAANVQFFPLLDAYLGGVHERHLSGRSLSTGATP